MNNTHTGQAGKKLSLKEKYALMTRGLGWDTSYEPMDKVFDQLDLEGIRIHDWDKWEDPFRLTMDAYWKYQAEKERKLYAVLDAFQQNNGHLNISDARYVNTLKLFFTGITPAEYNAHRLFAMLGRQFPGPARRSPARCRRWTNSATCRPRSTASASTTSTSTACTTTAS